MNAFARCRWYARLGATLLAAAVAGMWVRSHCAAPEAVGWIDSDGGIRAVQSMWGCVVFDRMPAYTELRSPPGFYYWSRDGATVFDSDVTYMRRVVEGDPLFAPAGVELDSFKGFWHLVVPYWMVFLLAAAWPGWVAIAALRRQVIRRKRMRRGACVQCGYDLRASPDRCPECGREA